MRNRMVVYYFRTTILNLKGGFISKPPRHYPSQVFQALISAAVCPFAWLNSSCTALAYSLLKHSFQIRKGTAERKGFHDGR